MDVEKVRTLESLARRRNEVLRRATLTAGEEKSSRARRKMEALRQLQASVKRRGVDLEAWEREIRDTRDAAWSKRLSVFDDSS